MRITIDFTRVNRGVPKIRLKWQGSSNDDVRMTDLGISVYEEIYGQLHAICNRIGGKEVVFENVGMAS